MDTNKLYYAYEVASIIGNGITANRVGRIANKYNLKTGDYGMYVQDEVNPHPGKSFHANVFKYNEKAIKIILIIWLKWKK